MAASDDSHAEIKELKSDVRADGFDSSLDTTNDIHVESHGDEHGNIHGEFWYVSPEGQHIKVSYVADEHGFQPSSDVLPVAPPQPEYIARMLKYIEEHGQKH